MSSGVRHLLTVSSFSIPEIERVLARAFQLKESWDRGERFSKELQGKVVAMIFEKPSLRTKVAFEVAASSFGATPVFLSSSMILASGGNEHGRESVPDIAINLERFADLILARVYSHQTVLKIAESISKPVINALCDDHHPTQAFADAMTIMWHRGQVRGQRVAFVGDGCNVSVSLMEMMACLGAHFRIASPERYQISPEKRRFAEGAALTSGGTVEFFHSPESAVSGADVVYTDTYIGMGLEHEKAERLLAFEGFQVDEKLLSRAKSDAIFMHCLPAHRGEEVTDGVMDGSHSVVFDQAECRLHIARSLLLDFLSS